MQVRYARWLSVTLLVLGLGSSAVHVWLFLVSGRISGGAIGSVVALLFGGFALFSPMISYRDETLGLHNVLGMRLKTYPRDAVTIEADATGKKLVYVSKNGKRKKILASPSALYDSGDAARFVAGLEA